MNQSCTPNVTQVSIATTIAGNQQTSVPRDAGLSSRDHIIYQISNIKYQINLQARMTDQLFDVWLAPSFPAGRAAQLPDS